MTAVSALGTTGVANAGGIDNTDVEPIEVIATTTILSQTDLTFDPNAFDYQDQLAKAGLDNIDLSECGMQSGDRLLTRSTTVYKELYIDIEIVPDLTIWAKIDKVVLDHWSWDTGWFQDVKSANVITVNNLKIEYSDNDTGYSVDKIEVTLWNRAGKGKNGNGGKDEGKVPGQGVPAEENVRVFITDGKPYNKYNLDLNKIVSSTRGWDWGHEGIWGLHVNYSKGSSINKWADKDATIFNF
jgi:hypothetical protein